MTNEFKALILGLEGYLGYLLGILLEKKKFRRYKCGEKLCYQIRRHKTPWCDICAKLDWVRTWKP